MYLGCSAGSIPGSMVEPLPDYSKPLLPPRGARPGLIIAGDVATLGHRQSSFGLVLTEKLTRQPKIRLSFDVNVYRYDGGEGRVGTRRGFGRAKVPEGSMNRSAGYCDRGLRFEGFWVAVSGPAKTDLSYRFTRSAGPL